MVSLCLTQLAKLLQIQSQDLEKHFSQWGEVVDARVIMDRENPFRSRGFGFVTFAKASDAADAASVSVVVDRFCLLCLHFSISLVPGLTPFVGFLDEQRKRVARTQYPRQRVCSP